MFSLFRKDASNKEDAILNDIRDATKSIKKSSVEQTACLRAWSDKNELDVDKYRKQVEKELDNDQGPKSDGKGS